MRRRLRDVGARLAPVLVGVVLWATPLPASAGPEDLRTLYAANGLLERGLYDLALTEYESFLETGPASADATTARYGRAVCLFRLGRTREAGTALEELSTRRDFDFAQDVLYLLAHCQVREGESARAVESLDRMLAMDDAHPSAPEARVLLVEALYRAGDHARVASEARDVLRSERDEARRQRVHLFSGLSALDTGKASEAAASFRAIVESDAAGDLATRARLLLAESLVAADKDEEAARWFEDVIDRGEKGSLARALYGLGALRYRTDEADASRRLLDRLLGEAGDASEADAARLLRGRIALDAGDLDRASELFEAVEMSRQKDLHDDAAYWLAKVELRRGRPEGAASTLAQALEQFPDSTLRAEMAYDRAVALTRMGQGEGALTAFAEFVQQHPRHELADDAVFHVASLLHDRGDYAESLEALDILEKRHRGGDDVGASVFLGAENKYMLELYEQAASDYAAFLDRYPEHRHAPMASFRLGMAQARSGAFAEGEPRLREAAAAASTQPVFRSALLMLGDGYFDAGRWAEAEQMLAEYVAAADTETPNLDDALIQLALARSRQQDHEGALEALEALLARDIGVHYAHGLFERGQALMGMGRWDEARAAFEQVVQETPRSKFAPFARRHMAALAQRRGDLERAAELYEAAAASGEGRFAVDARIDRAAVLIELEREADAVTLLERISFDGGGEIDRPRLDALRVIALARLDRCPEAVALAGNMPPEVTRALDPTLRDSMVYETAQCYRELARASEAREALASLIETGSEERLVAYAMLDVAAMEMDEGRHGAAVERLDQLDERLDEMGEKAPEELRGHAAYRRGVCAFETGQYAEAAAALKNFATRFAGSPLAGSAALIRGESLAETGRHEEALESLRLAAEPRWREETASGALLRLSEAHAVLQQWPASEEACREFLGRFPDSDLWFHARFGLGWALENQGRRSEAMEAYRQVVADHEGATAARAQFQIGECLYAESRYEDAIRELLRVDILYAYPEWSAAALYEAGRCFEAMGRGAEARVQYDDVVRRFGESSWADMAAERLKVLAPEGVPGHRS